MSGRDLVVRGRHVLIDGEIRPAAVLVHDGRVAAILAVEERTPAADLLDAGELVVMPGLVDTHVHIDEPGRTDWEGFAAATRAAAAGGVTTLVDMPLNSIPATTEATALRVKVAAADGQLTVDVGFWGGVVPGNAGALGALWDEGVLGFKCFLVPSGVPELAPVTARDLEVALPALAALRAPLLVHAELPGPIAAASAGLDGMPRRRYATWLASRPAAAEAEAIDLLASLGHRHGARVHVVHLSSAAGAERLRRARAEGCAMSAETCPHYLVLAAEDIADGATDHKCAPPVRGRADRQALWDALVEGAIDMVVSDHSPCPPALKEGDFFAAWGGIASLGLTLPLTWTAARARGVGLARVAQWMCAAPAALAGLAGRKGAIRVGADADLVVWNPEATFRVDPARLHSRHRVTPYAGRELHGVVATTLLRGRTVYDAAGFPSEPAGRLLRRGAVA